MNVLHSTFPVQGKSCLGCVALGSRLTKQAAVTAIGEVNFFGAHQSDGRIFVILCV